MPLELYQCHQLINSVEERGDGSAINPNSERRIGINAPTFRNLLIDCMRLNDAQLNARIAPIIDRYDIEIDDIEIEIADRMRSRSPHATQVVAPPTEAPPTEAPPTEPPRLNRTRERRQPTQQATRVWTTQHTNQLHRIIKDNLLYKKDYYESIEDMHKQKRLKPLEKTEGTEDWDLLPQHIKDNLDSHWHYNKLMGIIRDIQTIEALESNPHYIGMLSYEKKRVMDHWNVLHPPKSSKTPSRSKSKSSRSLSANAIKEHLMMASCRNKFEDIINATKADGYPVALKRIAYKLAKTCSKVTDTKSCTIDNLDNKIAKLREKWILHNMDDGIEFVNVIKGQELATFIKAATTYRGTSGGFGNFCRLSRENFRITYKDQIGVDAGGLFTQFMQNMADQLFEKELFVPVDDRGETYTFNTKNNVTISTICGAVITFLILNGVKLKYHLSRSILARLLYNDTEIRKEEYILYHLLDSPEFGNQFNNFIFDPSLIRNSMLTLNNDDDVTEETFRTYMEEVTLSLVTSQKSTMDAFSKGMLYGIDTRKTLRKLKFTISELDAIMCGEKITVDVIKSIIERCASFGQKNPEIYKWFSKILLKKVKFPEEDKRDYKAMMNQNNFMKALLYFWTGCSNYNSHFNYSLELTDNHLHSHTCIHQLVLPNHCKSAKELYSHIIHFISYDNFDAA